MEPLTKKQIMASFSKKDQKNVKVPDLSKIDWENLDFLGWMHPSGHLGYIVYLMNDSAEGHVFSRTRAISQKPKSCSICMTAHAGSYVNLFTTKSTEDKNRSVGQNICHDLKCSLYVRGKKAPTASQIMEHLTVEKKVKRLNDNLEIFFQSINK